jgi:abortive infection bacteriophage resistance protein
MTTYDKPFLTIAQQIEQLTARGIVIDDVDKATQYLERIGYYRLSAYWHIFRKHTVTMSDGRLINNLENDFKDHTAFKQIVDLYVFDKRLRLLMLDALERIEIALRTGVSLSVGQYNRFAQHDLTVFHNSYVTKRPEPTDPAQRKLWLAERTQFERWFDKYQKKVADSKEEFVTHFKEKYDESNLPIWV